MKQQRKGSHLRIQIRLALAFLGRDPAEYDGKRLTIPELEQINRDLAEAVEAKRAASTS